VFNVFLFFVFCFFFKFKFLFVYFLKIIYEVGELVISTRGLNRI
jgi:hypothetical protein